METVKDYKKIDNTFLVITDESLNGLDELYPYDMVQIKKAKKKLSKKEFNAFIDENWKNIKVVYKAIIVIGSELYKFFTKIKKAGNYHSEIYSYDGVKVLQGIKYHNSWLERNKYLYEVSQETIYRYLNELPVIRIWDYVDKAEDITTFEPGEKVNFKEVESSDLLVIDFETLGVRAENAEIYSVAITNPYNLKTIVFKWERRFTSKFKELIKDKTLIFHNALFDMKMIITNMFMNSNRDLYGMRNGIMWLKENVKIDDTMLMVYHCNNNTQMNELSLKFNALKYTGVYAIDVTDIAKALDKGIITEEQVLEYNATDTIATALLYKEYLGKLVREDVTDIYEKSIESIYYLIETMIVGLPLNKDRLIEVEKKLLEELSFIEEILYFYIDDSFNPGSSKQLSKLLYEVFEFPVLEKTDSGQPATGGEILKTLLNYTENKDIKKVLIALKDWKDIEKILTGFIEPFKRYYFSRNNTHWLTGNQKLGGTKSGRLSSNEPNLANLPSNSKYGKLIKSIFQAPEDWLFCGSDFAALEDRIVANLSEDPMKIGVFTKGIDGHSLNAAGYFREELESRGIFIDMNDPESINSVKKLAKDLRQESKTYTFGMNYGQLAPGMAKKQGIPLEKAEKIVQGYQDTYKVMIAWNESNKEFMNKNGYVRGCWGHKIKTPLIAMSVINSRITPSQVKAEFRTANNAITQSYGILTTVAGSRFQDLLEKSEFKYDIFLINQIHDAIYMIAKNEPEVIKWLNDNLISTMCIMDEPKLIDAPVKLEAELDIGKSWDKQETLKNNISLSDVKEKIGTL